MTTRWMKSDQFEIGNGFEEMVNLAQCCGKCWQISSELSEAIWHKVKNVNLMKC